MKGLKMKVSSIARPGRYMLVDVDSIPEFVGNSVVNFTIPSGVYYSSCADEREVYVGDFNSENTFGRIGLIPEAVALDAGYGADDIDVEFTADAECYFELDNGSFAFGSILFEPCYE